MISPAMLTVYAASAFAATGAKSYNDFSANDSNPLNSVSQPQGAFQNAPSPSGTVIPNENGVVPGRGF
jgi:hypothetical protein